MCWESAEYFTNYIEIALSKNGKRQNFHIVSITFKGWKWFLFVFSFPVFLFLLNIKSDRQECLLEVIFQGCLSPNSHLYIQRGIYGEARSMTGGGCWAERKK